MAAFFCRLTHHKGAKNGYFWGWKWARFCVFLPKNHLCTRPSEQPDMACDLLRRNPSEPGGGGGLAQHCCGVVGWKRKWWWLRRQLVCAVVSVSTRSPRAASLHAGLCLRHGVHTQARPQAGASRCSAFQERRGGAIAQRRERGGGRCGSHPRQLHNCRPELEPDSEWRTSRLVPAAGQPVPISMSRHRPHQLPRRSAQP